MNRVAKRPSPAPGIREGRTSQQSSSPDALYGKAEGADAVVIVVVEAEAEAVGKGVLDETEAWTGLFK